MSEISALLLPVLLFLFAAIVTVPVARYLGIGSVLGFLSAGIAIGPWGLKLISGVDDILHFSELGVVFLLFIIGLELNPSKLWSLRRSIFGVGAAQVLLTAGILACVLVATHFSWQAAVIGGIGLAMSSTAMALQLMQEKGMNRNDGGQLGFSVLLFQDMAVVPALALVPILAGTHSDDTSWASFLIKGGALVAMLIVGRYLLRPLFHYVAATGVREIFTATALFVVLGFAMFMDMMGFSMALGTFIAGVLLAESEFRHELENAIEPFKGLLLGLFFMSVGMALNLGVLYNHFFEVLAGVVILLLVKSMVLYLLAKISRVRDAVRLQFSWVLSQGGEFAFVLFSVANTQKLFSDEQVALLLVIVTLSMVTTPIIMRVVDNILERRYNKQDKQDEPSDVEDDNPQVIIAGFGRFGQIVGRLLMVNQVRVTVLERDVTAVSVLRRYGYKVYYGDATELELLRAAGAEHAKAIVVACNEPEDTMAIVQLCQQYFPHLRILARARGRVEAHELLTAGVAQFTRETFHSALALGRKTLMELGMHPHQAHRAEQHFCRLDMRMLRDLMPERQGDATHISRIKEARRELEDVFRKEMQYERRHQLWDEKE